MDIYEPLLKGCQENWLALEESERIELVKRFHENLTLNLDESAFNLHATVHVIVENQIALGEKYVKDTALKLVRQGLDEHEAIHAVGAVLSEHIHGLITGSEKELDASKYRRKLEKLTAKRWRKGQY